MSLEKEQMEIFKEFIEQECKQISLCCRATEKVVHREVRTVVAETAKKWFDWVDGLTNAEFDFIAIKELFATAVEGEEHDTERNDS